MCVCVCLILESEFWYMRNSGVNNENTDYLNDILIIYLILHTKSSYKMREKLVLHSSCFQFSSFYKAKERKNDQW